MLSTASKSTGKTLLILGEAPGPEEEKTGIPFSGASGDLLRTQLFPSAGLDITTWNISNVFSQRPPNNDLKAWTATKTDLKKLGMPILGAPVSRRYLMPQYWPQVEQTRKLVEDLQPDLILALGAKALWFLSDDDRIGTFRGTFFNSRYGKAMATYHPAAILREYKMLPIAVMDLIKVRMFLDGTLPQPLHRKLWINPTWEELEQVYQGFLNRGKETLGVDIETCPAIGQITTISFSFPDEGICIPLWNKDAAPGQENVYSSAADEVKAWRWMERFCKLPNPKVLQNGLYDMQYMLDAPIQLRLAGKIDDTAIMQHAYQPELRKDLGTLASFYLNEPSWKQMRTSAKDAKADD